MVGMRARMAELRATAAIDDLAGADEMVAGEEAG
jgi:hypothetical protein